MKKETQNELREIQTDEKIREIIHKVTNYITYFIVAAVVVAIILSFWSLPQQWMRLLDVSSKSLIDFLKYIINIVIAIELIHVLCHQTIDGFVDVLLMAVTRELVISELHTWEMLCGVLAIAVLFAIRKYLFVAKIDRQKPHIQIIEELLSQAKKEGRDIEELAAEAIEKDSHETRNGKK